MPPEMQKARPYSEGREEPENLFTELIDSIGAVVWEADVETFEFTFVSKQAEAMLGYPSVRWLCEKDFWLGIIHPGDKENVLAQYRTAGHAGLNHEIEYRLIAADGRTVWIHDSIYASRPVGKSPVNRGILFDITKRKLSELELLKQHGDLEARVQERTNQLLASNAALQAKILDHKRAEELLRHDIAGRELAEERIRQNGMFLARAQQMAHIGSWAWHADDGSVTWSDEMYRIYGLDPQSRKVTYDWFLERVHPADHERVKRVVGTARRELRPFEFEHRLVRPDGTIRTLRVLEEALVDADGKAIGTVGVSQDITDREEAAKSLLDKTIELERAQEASLNIMEDLQQEMIERRRAEKEMLEISGKEQMRIGQDLHDGLSQILTGITFMAKVLEQKLATKNLQEAKDASQIIDLVRKAIIETKGLSRSLYPIELERNGLIPALQELAISSESLFHVKMSAEIDPEIRIMDHSVATHLYRIAQEAIHNAVKHGKAKNVTLEFLKRKSSGCVLAVRDNGKGMPKEPGSFQGMGLRNMKYRAHMIGAELEILENPGGGTAVLCKLDKI